MFKITTMLISVYIIVRIHLTTLCALYNIKLKSQQDQGSRVSNLIHFAYLGIAMHFIFFIKHSIMNNRI